MGDRHGEWLVAGTRCSKLQALSVNHIPFKVSYQLYILLERVPFFLQCIWAHLTTDSWLPRNLKEKKLPPTWVFRFLTQNPLLMFSTTDASCELLTMLIPDNVLVETHVS